MKSPLASAVAARCSPATSPRACFARSCAAYPSGPHRWRHALIRCVLTEDLFIRLLGCLCTGKSFLSIPIPGLAILWVSPWLMRCSMRWPGANLPPCPSQRGAYLEQPLLRMCRAVARLHWPRAWNWHGGCRGSTWLSRRQSARAAKYSAPPWTMTSSCAGLGDTMYCFPPLTITIAEIDELIKRLGRHSLMSLAITQAFIPCLSCA